MHGNSAQLHSSTKVVSLGRPAHEIDAPINHPIQTSSTYIGIEPTRPGDKGYARSSNASWEPLEEALAALEGSELPGLLFGSGMGAASATMALAPIGSVIAVPSTSYSGSIAQARQLHAEGAVELREIDPVDIESTIRAFEGASLVWLESPTNPLLEVLDLPVLIEAAHAAGALVAVDNTFSTPLRQQPLLLGADIVIHSATKFIAGHSDTLLGVAITRDPELRARLHGKRSLIGSIPGAFDAWLGLRGLRTLSVRLDRAEETAGELARRLSERSEVTRVRYPGLPSDPGHELAARQLSGFGAIVSIEFATAAEAERFVGALELITPATSLGGVETLAERRRRHGLEPAEVPEELVRFSVGVEHVEDLWADIAQALERSAG